MKRFFPYLFITGLFLFPVVFFLPKALTVDDVVFVTIAEHIAHDPLHPFSFVFNWGGHAEPAYNMADPPLILYYLAAIIKVFGSNETMLHLSFLPFSLCVLFLTYFISRRFTPHPLLATVLVAVSPAFFVSATSLMMDIPFLALSLASIAWYVLSIEKKSFRLVLWTGLFAAGASLIKYTAIVPIGLIALGFILHKRIRDCFIFLVVISVVVLLWNGYFYFLYGTIHAVAVRSLGTAGNVLNFSFAVELFKGSAFLSFLGGTTLFITPLFLLLQPLTKRVLTCVFAAIHLLIVVYTGVTIPPAQTVNVFLFWLLLINGSLLFWGSGIYLFSLLAKNWRKKNIVFLSLWWMVSLAIPFSLSPFLAVRYLTFFLIPLAIIVSIAMPKNYLKRRSTRVVLTVCTLFSLILSFVVGVADFAWANTMKSYVLNPLPLAPSAKKVYFLGHWGIQYYAIQAGKNFLELGESRLQPGDILLIPSNTPTQEYPPNLYKYVKNIPLVHNFPVMTMSFHQKAGWYSQFWGSMPYVISSSPVEIIQVFEY